MINIFTYVFQWRTKNEIYQFVAVTIFFLRMVAHVAHNRYTVLSKPVRYFTRSNLSTHYIRQKTYLPTSVGMYEHLSKAVNDFKSRT